MPVLVDAGFLQELNVTGLDNLALQPLDLLRQRVPVGSERREFRPMRCFGIESLFFAGRSSVRFFARDPRAQGIGLRHKLVAAPRYLIKCQATDLIEDSPQTRHFVCQLPRSPSCPKERNLEIGLSSQRLNQASRRAPDNPP